MNFHPKGPKRIAPKPPPPHRAGTFPIIAGEPGYNPAEAARLLRETRERYGVSIIKLARCSGVSGSMICRIERGSRGITRETLERLLTAIEPTPEEANLIRLSAG